MKEVTFAKCPPGLFVFRGTMGLKTEFGSAFCCDTGEIFWGGTRYIEDRAKLIVQPINHCSKSHIDRQ